MLNARSYRNVNGYTNSRLSQKALEKVEDLIEISNLMMLFYQEHPRLDNDSFTERSISKAKN